MVTLFENGAKKFASMVQHFENREKLEIRAVHFYLGFRFMV